MLGITNKRGGREYEEDIRLMAQAGLNTRAHAICFSMPIDQIAGFRLGSE